MSTTEPLERIHFSIFFHGHQWAIVFSPRLSAHENLLAGQLLEDSISCFSTDLMKSRETEGHNSPSLWRIVRWILQNFATRILGLSMFQHFCHLLTLLGFPAMCSIAPTPARPGRWDKSFTEWITFLSTPAWGAGNLEHFYGTNQDIIILQTVPSAEYCRIICNWMLVDSHGFTTKPS